MGPASSARPPVAVLLAETDRLADVVAGLRAGACEATGARRSVLLELEAGSDRLRPTLAAEPEPWCAGAWLTGPADAALVASVLADGQLRQIAPLPLVSPELVAAAGNARGGPRARHLGRRPARPPGPGRTGGAGRARVGWRRRGVRGRLRRGPVASAAAAGHAPPTRARRPRGRARPERRAGLADRESRGVLWRGGPAPCRGSRGIVAARPGRAPARARRRIGCATGRETW